MATSLSNETSTTSLMELSSNPLLSGIHSQDGLYGSSSKSSNTGIRSDNHGFSQSTQGAKIIIDSSTQNSSTSGIKNRGDSISTASSYQQSQSALIQSASLAYPFLYPNSYLTSFPQASAASQYNYSNSAVGNGNVQAAQGSSGSANNRRGGKKKTPTTQSQNPELRLFFNLRRRDAQMSTNKGQSHVYKPKNPPSISEWYVHRIRMKANFPYRFKRLTVEERVNALSTVCPHLTETFVNMHKRIEESGQTSFARTLPNSQDSKYYQSPSYLPTYSQSINNYYSHASNDSSPSTFDENFYCRSNGETEIHFFMQNEKEKYQAEQVLLLLLILFILQEIFRHVRLTEYLSPLDTLTVTEDFVRDADYFFKLMSYATNNQAYSSSCQFETKGPNATVIEQPNWFKPKSFHSFATWVIVALEENLWAHYNYDNNANLGSAKANDLSLLFREKTDIGALDVDIQQLSQYWRDTNEKDKKALIDQFKIQVGKEIEAEFNLSHTGHRSYKSGYSKQMQYTLHIKEKPEKQSMQEQVENAVQSIVDFALRPGVEQDLMINLIYTTFDRCSSRQVNINRKLLELIKKKFKDDLMENLLQEEYQTVKSSSKGFKNKKKKKNFNSNSNTSNSNTGQQLTQSNQNTRQPSPERVAAGNDLQQDDQTKVKAKKKKGKANGQNFEKQNNNMNSQEQCQAVQLNAQRKKKKHNALGNFATSNEVQLVSDSQNPHSYSCDDNQNTQIDEDGIEKEDTVESDNKSSIYQESSSNNNFEQITGHHSNNVGTSSAATIISETKHKDTISNKVTSHNSTKTLGENSLKCVEFKPALLEEQASNDSLIKQQKLNCKAESKTFHVLQSNQNKEVTLSKVKRNSKNNSTGYSDNFNLSEDDTQKEVKDSGVKEVTSGYNNSEDSKLEEQLENQIVMELIQSMIHEACLETIQYHTLDIHKNNSVGFPKSQGNATPLQEEARPIGGKQGNKGSFGKKPRKESNQMSQKTLEGNSTNDEVVMRKKSFNSKKYVKDDKKFSEDYAAGKVSQTAMQSNLGDANESQNMEQTKGITGQATKNLGMKGGKQGQRKDFGIHLKHEDSGRNTASLKGAQDKTAWAKGTAKQPDLAATKKKSHGQRKSEEGAEQEEQISLKGHSSESTALGIIIKEDAQSNQHLNKRKRNKKKLNKLTDTDIMNNFMKSLHQPAEVSYKGASMHEGNFSQSSQNSKKKNFESRHFNSRPPAKTSGIDAVSESLQQCSLKSEQLSNTDDMQTKDKSYKQKYQTKNSNTNLTHQNSLDDRDFDSLKEELTIPDDSLNKKEQSESQQQQTYQVKNNQQHNQQASKPYYKQQRNTQKHLDQVVDDQESANSTKAECISEDRSPQSNNDKPLNPDNQLNPRSAAFRQLDFQTATKECENNSFTDMTGTTNTAVNSSLENNISQVPTFSKYQSYQNTPLKPVTHHHHPKHYHKQHTNQSMHSNDQESANYRTPPQLTKKQSTSSTYSHHGNYRKTHHNASQHSQQYMNHQQSNNDNQYSNQNYTHSHNGNNRNPQRSQGQYRQATRGATNNIYTQPMSISQSVQEQQRQFMHQPNYNNPESNNHIFYQDQSMLANINSNVDTYNKIQDSGIFHYVEKNPINMQQPILSYSPSQYNQNHANQFVPTQSNDLMANPFNYQRMHPQPYFDQSQSQDLIFQIFNSIKSNHSMSPIPQMISPPPLFDYQMSLSSDLSLQPQRSDSFSGSPPDSQCYTQLDNEIAAFVKSIEDRISLLKPERDYVLNKLSGIATNVFPDQSPKLILFGSLTTGLALESSDMDLAVTGLQIDDRFVMVTELGKLSNALKDWDCLESFKAIETASIPVIKMKVDLVKLRVNEMKEITEGDFTKRPIPEEQRYLSVDITFDDCPVQPSPFSSITHQDLINPTAQAKTHLGLQSCTLVQHYIAEYKSLKEVAILLKKFLAAHDLNSPYYGGISPYSTVLMIVAYMNYYGLRGHHPHFDMTPSRLLMGFLDFYGNYFNPASMGISVYDEGSPFYQLNCLHDSNFVILDPLNLQNNTTRNSYHTKEILLKFQSAFNNLKSLMCKLPQLQQAVLSSQTAFSKANSQDQKSSIPFENASPQPFKFQTQSVNIQQCSNNQYWQNETMEEGNGCDYVPHSQVPEEFETSNLAQDAVKDQQSKSPLQCQVSFLETFFAKDTQLAADLNELSQSQAEPRGTQITMIEEAHEI